MRGWIDFDNDGIFSNATEQVISFSEGSAPAPGRGNITVSAAFTVPLTAVLNSTLRLRLLEDLAPFHGMPALNNACINPVYGQAEDYPIYLLPSGALPLNLLDFSGLQDDKNVLLSWETNTEINTGYFIIQRSADNISFVDIGRQTARGQANQVTRYTFRDQQASFGKWYYRLKMVDMDDRYEFSKTITVSINENAHGDSRLMENPVSTFIDIQLRKNSTKTSLMVFDISGRKVMERSVPAGTSRYRINETSSLRPGIYLLEIRNANDRELIRFMKK